MPLNYTLMFDYYYGRYNTVELPCDEQAYARRGNKNKNVLDYSIELFKINLFYKTKNKNIFFSTWTILTYRSQISRIVDHYCNASMGFPVGCKISRSSTCINDDVTCDSPFRDFLSQTLITDSGRRLFGYLLLSRFPVVQHNRCRVTITKKTSQLPSDRRPGDVMSARELYRKFVGWNLNKNK
jgi:hypothetical protein